MLLPSSETYQEAAEMAKYLEKTNQRKDKAYFFFLVITVQLRIEITMIEQINKCPPVKEGGGVDSFLVYFSTNLKNVVRYELDYKCRKY